jgi:transposase
MNSIYTNADPELLKLFERAGSLRKVLCAPLDYAKTCHATIFCNGVGDILKQSFYVPNSPQGVEQLVEQITATCQHRNIPSSNVFFGGEDTPSYADNFTTQLRSRGFIVARVNALDAKEQREKHQASNDKLDLSGIAACLLKGRARILEKKAGLHDQLRLLVRERDFMVKIATCFRNRLHPQVDRLFPGFLNEKLSGISPYGPACWWLLNHSFSADHLAHCNPEKLKIGLEQHGLADAATIAAELQAYAGTVLRPDKSLVAPSQLIVKNIGKILGCLEDMIASVELPIAALLAQSPGARLSTVPGLGIILCAGLAAEIHLLKTIPPLSQLCAYAGIVPATEQTGGPAKEPRLKPTYPHFATRFKNYVMQAGEHMANVEGTDAQRLKLKAELEHQHKERVLAKHALGVVRSLLLSERAYLPARLYDPASNAQERGAYFVAYWGKLKNKWQGLVDHRQLFDPAQPLGRWRQTAQEAYGISLPLPGGKTTENHHQTKGIEH